MCTVSVVHLRIFLLDMIVLLLYLQRGLLNNPCPYIGKGRLTCREDGASGVERRKCREKGRRNERSWTSWGASSRQTRTETSRRPEGRRNKSPENPPGDEKRTGRLTSLRKPACFSPSACTLSTTRMPPSDTEHYRTHYGVSGAPASCTGFANNPQEISK